MKKRKYSVLAQIFVVAFIIAGLFYSRIPYRQHNTPETNSIITTDTLITDSDFSIHYIDVEQADSILIVSNDKTMLIDAGNNKDGKTVVDYIKNLNINKLDYVIATHPHADHIGGLDDVINNFDIGKIFMPKIQNNTKTFEDVLDAIANKNLKITTPSVGDNYNLGEANFTILSIDNNVDDFNLSSIVLRLDYGNCSYIFCGDAETPNEENMLNSGLNLKADIIKLGHHGSSTSSSKEFLMAVNPSIAIICVGTDNSYGHPHRETLEKLEALNIKYYRTDLNGNIVITSDKKNSFIHLEKMGDN